MMFNDSTKVLDSILAYGLVSVMIPFSLFNAGLFLSP